ncbi:MAG: GNAT family protein [Nanoarchaeota archaeon]
MKTQGVGFRLRAVKMSDAESIATHINHPVIAQNTLTIPHPYTIKDAKAWLAKTAKKKDKVHFGIDIKGQIVGGIGLDKKESHMAEIGYWLSADHWNKGIMTQAVRMMVDHGFKDLGYERVVAYVFLHNRSSARVLEKAGFFCEGVLHDHHKKDGKLIDAKLYARLKRARRDDSIF